MYPFRTRRGATFRCDADFAHCYAVNVFFYDSTRTAILFHVSLRRDENLIVVNRRKAALWHREIAFAMPFTRQRAPLEVQFSRGQAVVRVAGQFVGRFDAFPRIDRSGRFNLRRGFEGLRDIAFVEIEGQVVNNSLQITCPAIAAVRSGIPVLNDACEVVLQGLTEDYLPKGGKAVLHVSGFASEIPAVLRPLNYLLPRDAQKRRAHELAAIVPGRVWDTGADQLEMTLTDGAGALLAPITLSRTDLALRIGELAQSGVLASDDRAALQALEHARHAGIMALLTVEQKAALLSAADRFGLSRYVLSDTGAAELVVPAVRDDPRQALAQTLEAVRNQFTQTLRQTPQADAIAVLRGLLASVDLPPAALQDLLISLTEWFCLRGNPRDLARLWREFSLPDVAAANPVDDPWRASALLPLVYAQGQFDAVATALTGLSRKTKGWVLTPNIGWVMAQAAQNSADLDGRLASSKQRDAIVRSSVTWLKIRGRRYWDRTPCIAVIAGVVALLAKAETLSRPRADVLVRVALRTYALAPSFWAELDRSFAAHPWAVPQELQDAQAAFKAVQAHLDAGATQTPEAQPEIAARLQQFQTWGVQACEQVRREVLGPAGIPTRAGTLPDLKACQTAGMDPDEAALRFVAHPLTEPRDLPLSAEMTAAVGRGLKAAHTVVTPSPFAEAQAALLTHATALLLGADPARMQDLIGAMDATASVETHFLGVGIGLTLATLLLSQNRTDEAEGLVRRIVALAESQPEAWMRDKLAQEPAPSLAMRAMLAQYPDHPLTLQAFKTLRTMPRDHLTYDGTPVAAGVNPLLNTVVCLYSCRANLDTRVATIRKGWAQQLAQIGVPCLVFVGGGTGQRDGDVVSLDAPDDYEGLPQKTLAMVRWVLENTQFSYLVKVDDDCFLDPQAFFRDLAYQKHDYYGRPLVRLRGQMDRTWHMAKSTHPRGRLELDKSPEPSTYADGGSGYTVSRQAMAALSTVADTPQGQELIHMSFMEDKLTGDLLRLSGIRVSGEDYRMSVLRRTKPGGPLVPAWQNGFLPFVGSGVKLAHLDGHETQDRVLADSHKTWPSTRKIWPSFQAVKLGWNTNTLDLISTPETLTRVNAAQVAVVACLRNEMFMLPRFLEHYRGLGVQGFLIADNGSDDGSFEYLDAQPDVALFAVDTDYSVSQYGVAWQQALMSNFRVGRWSLAADADEFLFWNKDLTGSLPELTGDLDAEGADAARIFMLDMYPQASLGGADFTAESPFKQAPFVDRDPFLMTSGARGPYSNSDIWTSALRHRLIPGSRAELFVAQKYALLKYQPWMRLSAGLHFVADCTPSQRELFFAHFKYNAAFRAKAETEVARQQHFNDAEEYRKYLALVSEGRDVVFDPAVSVHWDACEFVRARLSR